MSISNPFHRAQAGASLLRACAALARVVSPRGQHIARATRPRLSSALAAAALVLGACAEAPTAPAVAPPPSGPSRLLVTTPGATLTYAQVSPGFTHTCAVSTAGALTCWGEDRSGQVTVPDSAKSGVAQVSAGVFHTCAVSTAGALACWGDDTYGQSTVPSGARSGMKQVTAGNGRTCALSTAGAVTCWGDAGSAQANVPDAAKSNVAQVTTGYEQTCAVSTAGALTCWGGTAAPSGVQSGVRQVSAKAYHTCAVSTAGAVTCWGRTPDGPLVAVPSTAGSGIAQVGAAMYGACALSTAGGVTCWGSDYRLLNVPDAAKSDVAQLSTGLYHACALSTAGALTCWGSNNWGQSTAPAAPNTTTRVLPTATFTAPATVVVGQPVALALMNAQVPGYPEATAFTYAFDCGSGVYGAASASNTASCPATAAGTLTVRGRVTDQSDDVAVYAATVTVLSAAQATTALRTAVAGATLAPDIRPALTSKLDDALKALAAGKTKAACSALADFTSQVQAQRRKAIPVATADAWLAQVAAIRSAAGC